MDEEPMGGQPVPPAPDGDEPQVVLEPVDTPMPPAVPPGAPPFTVRALLKDAFARYAADFVRIFLISAVSGVFTTLYSVMDLGRALAGRGPGPLETIVVTAFGIVWSAMLLALVGGGRSVSIRTAFVTGLRRSFRAFLAVFAIGLSAGAVAVVVALPAGLLLRAFPALQFGAFVVAGLLAVWVGVRLYLAWPGVVVDGLGASDALSLSWRITRPTAVWLRILVAVMLLLVVAAFATGAFGVLAILTASEIAFLGASVLATAIVTPIVVLVLFSAYRRLVPEHGLDWTSDPTTPPFVAPMFGRAAKLILAGALIAGVAGLVGFPFAINAILNEVPGTLSGSSTSADVVGPGKIAFGNTSNPRTCEVHGQRSTFTAAEGFAWVATLTTPATPDDKVALRVSQGGTVLGTVDEASGFFICIGPTGRDIGLPAGTYLIELLVNGSVRASGVVTLT